MRLPRDTFELVVFTVAALPLILALAALTALGFALRRSTHRRRWTILATVAATACALAAAAAYVGN